MPGPQREVWIVDDSPLEAELVRRTLGELFRVEVFADGASVIEQISAKPQPDALVLDWQMPGLSGIEVCQFLRSNADTCGLPILMLTVHNQTRALVEGLAAGADDFLAKPFNPAELVARVTTLVRARRMRERVDRAERSVRAMLMELPEAVLSVASGGIVTFANREAGKMLRMPPERIAGETLAVLLPDLKLTPTESSELHGLADVTVGDRVYSPVVRVFADVDSLGATTLCFRDMTFQRRLDAERARLLDLEREARAEAEAANRAKDDFLAIVSHELRTPLNAILGWSRMLRAGTLDAARQRKAIETVERNADMQKKLVEDLLDVSRMLSGKVELQLGRGDVGAVVEVAVEAARPACVAGRIEVECVVAQGLPPAPIDADRLQQVIGNLIGNAIKFTPPEGRVMVTVDRVGDAIEIRVKDTGQGIDPAFLPHIFERFRQAEGSTTRRHGGLGLGLAIVRHIVDLHEGTITAESPGRGKGACFSVRLPLSAAQAPRQDGEAPRTRRGAPPGALEDLTGLRIVVLEDDTDSRELVTSILSECGAEVVGAVPNVAEGIRVVASQSPDVVLSDIGLPDEDGYSFVQRMRGLEADGNKRVIAIAITAFARAEDRRRALASGFDGYVAKPLEPAALTRTIAGLAAKRL